MGNNKIIKNIATAIVAVLVLLLIAGAVNLIFRLTNGGTDELKTFYVANDDEIFSTKDKFVAPYGEPVCMDVNYPFILNSEKEEYSVEFLPVNSDDAQFDYTVDGQVYHFPDEGVDFNTAFNLKKYDDYFTFEMPYDMQTVLQKVYASSAVEIPTDVKMTEKAYFKVVVTSYNEKNKIEINLTREIIYATGVELPGDDVLF